MITYAINCEAIPGRDVAACCGNCCCRCDRAKLIHSTTTVMGFPTKWNSSQMGGIRGNIAKSLVVDDMKLFVGECNDVVVVVDHEITKSKIENRHAANDPESSCSTSNSSKWAGPLQVPSQRTVTLKGSMIGAGQRTDRRPIKSPPIIQHLGASLFSYIIMHHATYLPSVWMCRRVWFNHIIWSTTGKQCPSNFGYRWRWSQQRQPPKQTVDNIQQSHCYYDGWKLLYRLQSSFITADRALGTSWLFDWRYWNR